MKFYRLIKLILIAFPLLTLNVNAGSAPDFASMKDVKQKNTHFLSTFIRYLK